MKLETDKLKAMLVEQRDVYAETGRWEVGGPWPSVSVIYCVDGGSSGMYDAPEPPTYAPICLIHQSRDFTTPPPLSAIAAAEVIADIFNAFEALAEEVLESRKEKSDGAVAQRCVQA